MSNVRFLQIHSLHNYTAALLNRDDSGFAKRLSYGGVSRTRISSQCLKRHWRTVEDPHALQGLADDSQAIRSREIVTHEVIGDLKCDDSIKEAIEESFQKAVYGDKGASKKSRQPLLLGAKEIAFLKKSAEEIVQDSGGDAKAAKEKAEAWGKEFKTAIKAMRDATELPGGIIGALFGRMVTSDTDANIDAPLHVAHSFTVHAEESESDYFTVVDDLASMDDTAGTDHIGETELTSGLFYGYVVVDRKMLLDNLGAKGGVNADLAGKVVENLIHLIATVSPGAKLGSTAPYGYASCMLVEAGDRQPRSLAEAFRNPCGAVLQDAEIALKGHLTSLDDKYSTGESRRVMSLSDSELPAAKPLSLPDLAKWAGESIHRGEC